MFVKKIKNYLFSEVYLSFDNAFYKYQSSDNGFTL